MESKVEEPKEEIQPESFIKSVEKEIEIADRSGNDDQLTRTAFETEEQNMQFFFRIMSFTEKTKILIGF